MTISGHRRCPRGVRPAPRHLGQRGQGLAEFALIAPILLLVVVAIADFGRLFNSMVAVEAATREAADYGAFKSSYWDASLGNPAVTTVNMRQRACTAAWGSHLEDYSEPGGTINHLDCTNPVMTCKIEPTDGSAIQDCDAYTGTICSDSTNPNPCAIHVSLTYNFRPFFNFSILGWTPLNVTFTRNSLFRISDLPAP